MLRTLPRSFLTPSLFSVSLYAKNPPSLSFSAVPTAMECDGNSSFTLVLGGKSGIENEIARTLKRSNSIKLINNTEVLTLLHPEIGKAVKEESFLFELFMNSLSTNRFDQRPRLKNHWESPKGCLMFSFTLQLENGRIVPLLQYVVSLAVSESIKDICYKNGLPHLDVKIKWPNDLYLNSLKVGGILCTSTYRSKRFDVSAGIGLNVDNEQPTTCLNAAMRELSTVAYKFRREDIIAAFFNKFEIFFDIFINQGFQALEELYYRTWLHSGQRVVIQEKNGQRTVEHTVTIQGLTVSGYLLAMGEDRRMYELHPDGNSLDFFKGLVRRKLDG